MKIPAEAGTFGEKNNAAITYSRLATTIGRADFTSVFGMVTGVSPHVSSPRRTSYPADFRRQVRYDADFRARDAECTSLGHGGFAVSVTGIN